jgi:hypothetical protein
VVVDHVADGDVDHDRRRQRIAARDEAVVAALDDAEIGTESDVADQIAGEVDEPVVAAVQAGTGSDRIGIAGRGVEGQ